VHSPIAADQRLAVPPRKALVRSDDNSQVADYGDLQAWAPQLIFAITYDDSPTIWVCASFVHGISGEDF
jgi:hypothetical protein